MFNYQTYHGVLIDIIVWEKIFMDIGILIDIEPHTPSKHYQSSINKYRLISIFIRSRPARF
ncbi:hypothetical protein SAMN05421761_103339 [Belliella pelovolcani]|uniref:Uncharacterized protein n=1 Tax=Belliella pelovolcani TaxID=529505 RepID=A0A1N7LHJ8_9BACT|nr:hypothetical protein SAMN05421761_103339 [Belliella pelovolcani]